MANQTPIGMTYPEPGDHTRIWEHFQQLAEDADDLIDGIFLNGGLVMQVGLTPSFGPSGAASATTPVTFPTPFGAGTVFVLVPNINAAVPGGWNVRAASATPTGFTANLFGVNPSTFTVAVTYLAIGPRP